jgi:uncharacterized membrane protein YebE (DUF533 family)
MGLGDQAGLNGMGRNLDRAIARWVHDKGDMDQVREFLERDLSRRIRWDPGLVLIEVVGDETLRLDSFLGARLLTQEQRHHEQSERIPHNVA